MNRLFIYLTRILTRRAASRLSKAAKASVRARKIERMNQLRRECGLPEFVPGKQHG